MPTDFTTQYDGIIVRLRTADESAMFPGLVNEALLTINSRPRGRALLDGIVANASKMKFGFTICIMRPSGLSVVNDGNGPQWSSGSICKRTNEMKACDGTGCVSSITWNANVIATPDGARPAFIGLAHELIHAYYSLLGQGVLKAKDEEYCTVGLPPHALTRDITENSIRAEHGLPMRMSYVGL